MALSARVVATSAVTPVVSISMLDGQGSIASCIAALTSGVASETSRCLEKSLRYAGIGNVGSNMATQFDELTSASRSHFPGRSAPRWHRSTRHRG